MSDPATGQEIFLRRAVPEDSAALAALAERTFTDAFGAQNRPEDLAGHVERSYGEVIQRREIEDPSWTTFVATNGSALVAYFQLVEGAAPVEVAGASPIEIRRFYVDAPWHGKGLAQRLMATALELAAAAGNGVVWLGVWEENPRGIAFYRKCGFEPVGHHTFVVGSDPQRDVLMARKAFRA
jgi:GNAT superfamily N-acetyltransferase